MCLPLYPTRLVFKPSYRCLVLLEYYTSAFSIPNMANYQNERKSQLQTISSFQFYIAHKPSHRYIHGVLTHMFPGLFALLRHHVV